MGNSIFAFPNWIDEDYSAVQLHGGSWDAEQSIDKLRLDDINDFAISSDATEASTQFEADLGTPRDMRLIAMVNTNLSVNAKRRFRLSNTASFSGATIDGANSSGVSSVTFAAGTSALDINEGDVFTIAGDATQYTVASDVSIAASGTGSVSFTPVLVGATSGAEVVTCHSGDYTAPVYDDGAMVKAYPVIYPWGTLPYYHPSWYTGLPTQSDIDEDTFPIYKIFSTTLFARFVKVEISDTTNAQGQIEIGRLFTPRGVQPTYNLAYGATSLGFITNTKIETTLSGRRVYDEKPMQRLLPLEIRNLPQNEALTKFYDMQKRLNKNRQMFFVFDPDDTALMHRRSFAATIGELDPIQFPYFNVNNIGMQLIEVI